MKIKNLFVLALTICVLFSGIAYADGHEGMDLEKKFYMKAKMIMSNQEELGLSDSQIKEIKKLKMDTKKDIIKTDAEIEIVKLDIKSQLWEDKIDTGIVNGLIDKKYDLKKEKAKMIFSAYAYITNSLTGEQQAKLKAVCKKSMEGACMMSDKKKEYKKDKM